MTLAPNWKNCPNCAAKDAEIERLRAIEAVAQALCEELPEVKWLRHLRAALAQPKEER